MRKDIKNRAKKPTNKIDAQKDERIYINDGSPNQNSFMLSDDKVMYLPDGLY